MKVLGLDLSTSTGVSIFDNDELKDYTIIKSKVKGNARSETYPQNYINMAEDIALKIVACIMTVNPDYIIIEETNKAKERFRQKMLEFIHFAVGKAIGNMNNPPKIRYIDTSSWRKILGHSLDTDQRSSNKARKKGREAKREEISKNIYNQHAHQIQSEIEGLGKRDTNKVIKRWDKEISKMVGKEMAKFRSPQKVVDSKTLAVEHVNEHFNLGFKRSQNDIADSICLCHAFILNNYSVVAPK